ncbi:MAG: hypothetical protein QME65_02795, partial [Candidatus Omnitrophota bacterium]|nr:hypothetical protein [Candidatus Omnitrophota bacterium]
MNRKEAEKEVTVQPSEIFRHCEDCDCEAKPKQEAGRSNHGSEIASLPSVARGRCTFAFGSPSPNKRVSGFGGCTPYAQIPLRGTSDTRQPLYAMPLKSKSK